MAEQVGQEDGHWFLKDGKLVRENSIDKDAGTWRAAILTYSKQTFSNFEMEVDYKQGNQTFWWTGVAFRQAEAGKSFFDDGAGIFVQEGGQPTMWGAIGVGGRSKRRPIRITTETHGIISNSPCRAIRQRCPSILIPPPNGI